MSLYHDAKMHLLGLTVQEIEAVCEEAINDKMEGAITARSYNFNHETFKALAKANGLELIDIPISTIASEDLMGMPRVSS